MGAHADLLARHRNVLPDWIALYFAEPISIVRGEGRTVWDAEGNEYLDLFGGILTTMVGHAVPEVVDAIKEQAAKMLHTSTLYLIEPMIALAEKIAGLSGIPDARVFLVNSGSEANDAALLLASTFRSNNQVLTLRGSYHGGSLATMPITNIASWKASSLSPMHVSYVHGGYRYRSPFGHLPDDQYIDACIADLRDVLSMTGTNVATMIAEPIQGVGGFITPPDGLLGRMHEVLREYGILWISDEVQTGWGRTGEHFWGYQAHNFTPDMLTFAKGVGNGLAMGGVVATSELMNCVKANHISTFGGNPVASAGALATLEYLLDHDLQTNSVKVGNQILNRLRDIQHDNPMLGDVRGRGLMAAVEIVKPGTKEPDTAATAAVLEGARARGVLIGKGGLTGNTLRIAPPLSITEAEADTAMDALAATFESLRS
jgi:4-aminobutyrate aminotransferase